MKIWRATFVPKGPGKENRMTVSYDFDGDMSKKDAKLHAHKLLRADGGHQNDYFSIDRKYLRQVWMSTDEYEEYKKASAESSGETAEASFGEEKTLSEETKPADSVRVDPVGSIASEIEEAIAALRPGDRYIRANVPERIYRASTGYSTSNMKTLLKSTAEEMKAEMDGLVKKESRSMDIGRAAHCAILEPDIYAQKYVRMPEHIVRKSGKDWQAFKEENEGKEVLSADDWDKIEAIAEKVKSPDDDVFTGGLAEVSGWYRTDSGVVIKARADYLHEGVIIDLKTAQSVSDEDIFGAFDRYLYHLQRHVYMQVFNVPEFAFFFVKTTAPYSCQWPVYVEDEQVIEDAQNLFDKAMDKLLQIEQTGEYPGYSGNGLSVQLGYQMRKRLNGW